MGGWRCFHRGPSRTNGSIDVKCPIDVTIPPGDYRRGEPITIGVPLSPGGCHDPGSMTLIDPTGQPIDVQTRPLDRWTDGSARWILLDFQSEGPGGTTNRYYLSWPDEIAAPSRTPAERTATPVNLG